MARPKSDFLSALGVMFEIWKSLVDEVLSLGGTDEDLRQIKDNRGLRAQIAQLIVTARKEREGKEPFRFLPFGIWKEIQIGGVNRDKLAKSLKSAGHKISDWANDIMGKPAFTTEPAPRTIQLVRRTVRELGFTSQPTTTELLARIREVGELLPAEAGPHLRLGYTDQPMGEWVWLMMEPIVGFAGDPFVFRVERIDRGSWLHAGWTNPDNRWSLDYVVVFGARK